MSNGRLGSAVLAENVGLPVYTCPANKTATVNFSAVNGSDSDGLLNVCIMSGGAPVAGEGIERDSLLEARQGIERTAIVLAAGQSLHFESTMTPVEVNVWGFEE